MSRRIIYGRSIAHRTPTPPTVAHTCTAPRDAFGSRLHLRRRWADHVSSGGPHHRAARARGVAAGAARRSWQRARGPPGSRLAAAAAAAPIPVSSAGPSVTDLTQLIWGLVLHLQAVYCSGTGRLLTVTGGPRPARQQHIRSCRAEEVEVFFFQKKEKVEVLLPRGTDAQHAPEPEDTFFFVRAPPPEWSMEHGKRVQWSELPHSPSCFTSPTHQAKGFCNK